MNSYHQRFKSLPDRFWEKVDRRGPDDCWLWQATKRNGYGAIKVSGQMVQAHRVALMMATGPFADDLYVCHRCDNKLCVNPAHLFLGSHEDNMRDMRHKRRAVSGERHSNTTLTEAQVLEIRSAPPTIRHDDLARQYGVASGTISKIRNGKSWIRFGANQGEKLPVGRPRDFFGRLNARPDAVCRG